MADQCKVCLSSMFTTRRDRQGCMFCEGMTQDFVNAARFQFKDPKDFARYTAGTPREQFQRAEKDHNQRKVFREANARK